MSHRSNYMRRLILAEPLRDAVMRSAVEIVQFSQGSHGLDAGCGIGSQALILAKAVGPEGHVTGLDVSREFLSYAAEAARNAGLDHRVTFRQGDISALPFDDDHFDWVWSTDCIGYAPIEPLPLVKELARVVKSGGRVAILAYSSQQLLPGYPFLDARLNATAAGVAPFAEGMRPEWHFARAMGWFHAAGLEDVAAFTLVRTVHAPLADDLRAALADLFQMRWCVARSDVSSADWDEFQRLCHPESRDFILCLPDYYAFFTYSLFCGEVT